MNAHIGAILCYNFYSFCYMVMSKYLTMFERKSNCICNKSLLYCAPKPNTRKQKYILHSNVKMQIMFLKIYISMEIYCP